MTIAGCYSFCLSGKWQNGEAAVRLQAVVRFCRHFTKILLFFLGHVLLQDTEALQQPHLTETVYQ